MVTKDGVPLTTPARTLVDLASRLSPALIAKVVDEGAVCRLWTPDSLRAAVDRVSRHRRGTAALRRVLEDRSGAFDSGLEQRVEAAVRGLGAFQVHFQIVVDGRVIILDLALPELKLAIECDGWTVRSRSRTKFDEDRRKGNLLAAAGWQVVRVTAAMSDDEIKAAVVAAMVRAARTTA